MVKCSEDCIPCCDYCKYVLHEVIEHENIKVVGGPIFCKLHLDGEHTHLVRRCGYCDDFFCKNAESTPPHKIIARRITMDKCRTCEHYTGGGDWNLCCTVQHPTPKEREMGKTFTFGHLCYEDTDACDMYAPNGNKINEVKNG